MAPKTSKAVAKAPEEQTAALNKATAEAFRELRQLTEKHGPLHRDKGRNMRSGLDIVDQSDPSRPLTRLGVIAIAVEKLKQLDRMLRIMNRGTAGATVEPSAGHDAQAGQSTQTGASTADAIVIADSMEGERPPAMLVAGDYLAKVERENHLLRSHILHFERGVIARLEKELKQITRIQGNSVPKQSNAQAEKAAKEGMAGVQGEDITHAGKSRQPVMTATGKRSKIVILKVDPRSLKKFIVGERDAGEKQVVSRKRGRDDFEGAAKETGDASEGLDGAGGKKVKVRKLNTE